MSTYEISHRIVVLTRTWHPFIHVDAANKIVYELVAEPVQEPQAGGEQEEAGEQAPEEVANPADLQGKPRSITPTFTIMNCS